MSTPALGAVALSGGSGESILQIAREVIRLEAMGLAALESQLDHSFSLAVDWIHAVSGRVIVSGMGKSGHVGRKIAATFASTGTPAHFVHPAEASHGDLGMITQDDLCLVISNSGETKELSDLVGHCKRFGISLIAMTRDPESTLGRQANIVLKLPDVPEACRIGIVPTTSTTATLVLGDALALTLMRLRGFGSDQFLTFHPGGKLGAQLITVGNLMHTGDSLPVVPWNTPMTETLVVMTSKGFGLAIVSRGGILYGVITDGDLRRNMCDLLGKTAADVCSIRPKTISADKLASEALRLMNENKISALCVTSDDQKIVGLVHVHDCIRAGVI